MYEKKILLQIVVFFFDFDVLVCYDSYVWRVLDQNYCRLVCLFCRYVGIFVELNDYETLVSGKDFCCRVVTDMDRAVTPSIVSECDFRISENKTSLWVANAVFVVDIDVALAEKLQIKVLQNVVV